MRQIYFLLIVGVMCFLNVGSNAGESVFISNKKLIEHVEVHTYLLTRGQASQAFANPSPEIVQKSNKELKGEKLFLLVRCRNRSDSIVDGELSVWPPSHETHIPVQVITMSPMEEKYHNYLIYVGDIVGISNEECPNIRYEWYSIGEIIKDYRR